MYILTANLNHDGSLSLLKDGVILETIATERYTREKRTYGIRKGMVHKILNNAGLKFSDISLFIAGHAFLSYSRNYYKNKNTIISDESEGFPRSEFTGNGSDDGEFQYEVRSETSKLLGIHPLEEAEDKICTIMLDGVAVPFQYTNHLLGHHGMIHTEIDIEDSKIVVVTDEVNSTISFYPKSRKIYRTLNLSWFYAHFSRKIFFHDRSIISTPKDAIKLIASQRGGPGKLMGLSSYGTVKTEWLEKLLIQSSSKSILNEIDFLFFNNKRELWRQMSNLSGELVDAVKTFQEFVSLKKLKDISRAVNKNERIFLTGGFFLNCPTNTKIINYFDKVYIAYSPDDSTISEGLGLDYFFRQLKQKNTSENIKKNSSPYKGQALSKIEETLNEYSYFIEYD